jgi:alditol oxidase
VQEIVATAPRIRVLGSRHSFTGIADSAQLVSLEAVHAARTSLAGIDAT